MDLLLVFVIK